VLAVYWPVLGFEFVSYDDSMYVTRNRQVQRGLGAESLWWAWTTLYAANWQPLTWMSHMVDWDLYGPHPGGHHATSVLLHATNALLLFALLDRNDRVSVAGRAGCGPLRAAPAPRRVRRLGLRAEGRAQRILWFLTLLAYVGYVRAPSAGRYAVVALGLVLGLAAKPMVVTLPFTLLLLDYWPLARLGGAARTATAWRLVREKIPLIVVVTAASTLTIVAQRRGGAMGPLSEHPLGVRIGNAVVSYVSYLGKALWPQNLSILYPHPVARSPCGASPPPPPCCSS
jgi:hypothetical protein